MKYILLALLCFFFSGGIVFASVLSDPENSFILLDIDDPVASRTYYGKLDNFPHTYQFHITATTTFSAQVAGVPQTNIILPALETEGDTEPKLAEEKVPDEYPDLSIILVKVERRGVSEVDRVRAESTVWTKMKQGNAGLKLVESAVLTAALAPGVYKLEVSAPENLSPYQLRINGGSEASYKELFMARSVFKTGWLSLLLQWRVYIPMLLIIGFWYGRTFKKKKHV